MARTGEQSSPLQAIMDDFEARLVDRHRRKGGRGADQDAPGDLRDAVSVHPSQSPDPEAKEKIEALATEYKQCQSRSKLNLKTWISRIVFPGSSRSSVTFLVRLLDKCLVCVLLLPTSFPWVS
ncbi:hypothetical protein RSAG8_03589, partial [Rhizoctonia solani AG-8 WAC10335]